MLGVSPKHRYHRPHPAINEPRVVQLTPSANPLSLSLLPFLEICPNQGQILVKNPENLVSEAKKDLLLHPPSKAKFRVSRVRRRPRHSPHFRESEDRNFERMTALI